jgi:predicted transcriptional regulator
MNKQEVLDMIEHLPDPIDPEQLMTELYWKAKLDRAEAAVARGEVVSQEEVVQRSRQWFVHSSRDLLPIPEKR